MRRRVLHLAIFIAACLVAWQTYVTVRWSSWVIVPRLLEELPLGTDREVVMEWIGRRDAFRGCIPGIEPDNALWARIGRYSDALGGDYIVHAVFVFDERGKLTGIHLQTWCMNAL